VTDSVRRGLPPGYTVRRPRLDDLDEVVALVAAADLAVSGETCTSAKAAPYDRAGMGPALTSDFYEKVLRPGTRRSPLAQRESPPGAPAPVRTRVCW